MKIVVDSCVFINSMKADSVYRTDCLEFLELLARTSKTMSMPAHGWFEVYCSFKRIERIDKTFCGTPIGGKWNFPIELIHIDKSFIEKYGNVDIPYTKAGDHIYLVVAYVNRYPLVTTDNGMSAIGKQLGLKVYSPAEFVTLQGAA